MSWQKIHTDLIVHAPPSIPTGGTRTGEGLTHHAPKQLPGFLLTGLLACVLPQGLEPHPQVLMGAVDSGPLTRGRDVLLDLHQDCRK